MLHLHYFNPKVYLSIAWQLLSIAIFKFLKFYQYSRDSHNALVTACMEEFCWPGQREEAVQQ